MSEAAQSRQYLSFFIRGGEYALEILQVREIIPHGEVTRLPRVPDFVSGLLNLRGAVVPIVDLGLRLGFEATVRTKRSCIVVTELELNGEWTRIGLLTDDVSQVLDLGPDDVEPAPALGAPVDATLLRGIGKVGERFILILDPEAVFGSDALRTAWAQIDAASSPPAAEDSELPANSESGAISERPAVASESPEEA